MAPIHRHRQRLLAAALLGLLAVAGGAADRDDTEAQLKQVRDRIGDLQRDIRKDSVRRNSVVARLRDAELGVAQAQGELTRLRGERTTRERRRAELQEQRQRVETSLQSERAELAGQLRAAYMLGREEQLRLLLNQQDPARLGRLFAYYSYFGRSRAARIDAIRDQLASLAALDRDLDAENARLAQLEAQADEQLNALKAGRDDRAKALNELEKELKNRKTELARLKQNEEGLKKLLAELRRVMADFPLGKAEPFEKAKGRLGWPVSGKVVANFGQRRAAGLTWNGMLIATERGSKVRAVYYGRVIYADWLPGMGLLTIVEHSGGYLSLYGHNEQLYKSVGESVAPGDVIAGAGDSGGSNRPELYLEIRKGSKPLNPNLWIRK